MKRVAITGASGNLGWKLLLHLSGHEEFSRVVGLDVTPPSPEQLKQLETEGDPEKAEFITCDLTEWNDLRWRDTIDRCDAVVHFAAKNPYPEATWDDANSSLDMTFDVAMASVAAEVGRFVFASSNHVMGRYKDEPLASRIGPGELASDLEHGVGTLWTTAGRQMDSTVYAVAKSSGERLCHALSTQSEGRTTFACIRIGWCQPGENLPSTLSAAGTPTQSSDAVPDAETARNEEWFRNMWLSNRDFVHLFERALLADSGRWPDRCIVVNGMSDNTGMKWSLRNAKDLLGYEPQDDVSQ